MHPPASPPLTTRVPCPPCRPPQSPAYLLWAYSTLQYKQLQNAVGVALRLQQGGMTLGGLRAAAQAARHAIDGGGAAAPCPGQVMHASERLWAFMRSIRGAAAYWASAASDLHAMVRQLGPPTWLVTLSAADLRWPDLALALAPPGTNLSSAAARTAYLAALTPQQRRAMLRDNPVGIARHFSNRWALVLSWIQGEAQPLGAVTDVWWRVEFQRRGSAHVHFFLWCAEAPNPATAAGLAAVVPYLDRYVNATVPPAGHPLRQLVLQQHRHTATCQRPDAPRGACRFGFPRAPAATTRLGGAPGARCARGCAGGARRRGDLCSVSSIPLTRG